MCARRSNKLEDEPNAELGRGSASCHINHLEALQTAREQVQRSRLLLRMKNEALRS